MSAFYDDMIATATALIKEDGRPITLIHVTDTAPTDSSKPWDKPPPGTATYPTFGAFIDVSKDEVDGEKIKATDLKLLVSAEGVPWDVETKDIVNDTLYGKLTILKIDLIQPGPVKVLYTFFVRRG